MQKPQLGNMTYQRQQAMSSRATLMKKLNTDINENTRRRINQQIHNLNFKIAQLNSDIKHHPLYNPNPNEGFRNPNVLTKDQMMRKIMTKVRLMTKAQLKRFLTKLNKLTVN